MKLNIISTRQLVPVQPILYYKVQEQTSQVWRNVNHILRQSPLVLTCCSPGPRTEGMGLINHLPALFKRVVN